MPRTADTRGGQHVHGQVGEDVWRRFHADVRAAANRALDGYAELPDGPTKAWAWGLLAALTDACHDLDETLELSRMWEQSGGEAA